MKPRVPRTPGIMRRNLATTTTGGRSRDRNEVELHLTEVCRTKMDAICGNVCRSRVAAVKFKILALRRFTIKRF